MSSLGTNQSTLDLSKKHYLYRFGQSFSEQNVREFCDRDPYARFVVYGLVQEALGGGFELIDVQTEEVLDISSKVWKTCEPLWKDVIHSGETERKYGYAIAAYFISDKTGNPFLKIFEPADVDRSVTDFYNDGSLKKIRVNDYLFNGELAAFEIEGETMQYIYLDKPRQKRKFYEGRSYIEDLWDTLWSLHTIRQAAVMFAIRCGAGMRILAVPENIPKEIRDKLKEGIRDWDSFNGYFVVPEGVEATIETGHGTVDYTVLRDVLLEALSARIKVPMARLKGIEAGQIEGATVNEQAYFDVLRMIQREKLPLVQWLLKLLNEHYNWGLAEDSYTIRFNVRPELTEKDQAEVDYVNAQKYTTYISNGVMEAAEVREELGYDPATTPVKPSIKFEGLPTNFSGTDTTQQLQLEEQTTDAT